MSNYSNLLHYVYFFHAAPLCLLFPRCCGISTFSMLLNYANFFHAAVLNAYFQCGSIMSTSMLLRYIYFIQAAALWLPFTCCFTISTFSHCRSLSTFLAHLSHRLMVSYCDRWMSVLSCVSSVLNNCFKGHLLLNYWIDFLPNLVGMILI